ncbi:MAG: GWxTD domain-containing protein [candidate division Zixibacteria bacterium]|nr:GWxTD domain-containing protein [candidate division Zixibacteria bacterium]
MRQKLLIVVLAAGLGIGLSTAATVEAQQNKGLTVHAGASFFNNPAFDSLVQVEFPFTLNRGEYEFYQPDSADSRLVSRIYARLDLFGVDGLLVDSASTYFGAAVATEAEAARKDYKLFNYLAMGVRPGVYSAQLHITDVVSKRTGEVFYDRIVVEPPRKTGLMIAGKYLAYRITNAGDDDAARSSRTYRNGYQVLYNPLGFFAPEDTALFLYSEIYNLDYVESQPYSIQVSFAALDASDAVHKDFGSRELSNPGEAIVLVDVFDIRDWLPASYRLRMIAVNRRTEQADTTYLPFRIVSPSMMVAAAEDYPEFDPYDTLSLEIKERLVKYLLTSSEETILRSLTPEGREAYLKRYWQDHDETPGTPQVENRREMIERYLYANNFFSTDYGAKGNGWQSDRGRIYMVYGPWEERDDIQAPMKGNPFQVWYYHTIKEGTIFVFEEQHGYNDYMLVHSNMQGETYSDEWKAKLEEDLYKIY